MGIPLGALLEMLNTKQKAKLSFLNSAFMLVLALLGSGCSQNSLLTRQDYQKSQQEFLRGEAESALLDFPRAAESGTFNTAMEQGYLSLMQGKPQIKGRQKPAEALETRV